MNCIRHGKKNVVGKQKFQLISEVIHLYKSNQFTLLKWQLKKLGFQRLRLRDLLISGMKKEVFRIFYWTTIRSGKKRKKVLEKYRKN